MPSLGNMTVLGTGGFPQTVIMQSSPLATSGTLTINTGSTLNTNALDVTIGGDLTINGTYNGSNNTTIFNGVGAQAAALSASSQFQNITVDKPSGTVTLSGTSPTITNLNLLSGVLNVGALGLTVQGNVVNNSSQIGSGAIVMSGSSTVQSITSSGGSFTNLTLGGAAATKNVTVNGALTINGTLNFATTSRYLTIGSSELTFGTAGAVTGAGASAFIRTNGVSSDAGVVKLWPVAGAASFTYAVGTQNNYTPVVVTLTVTSAGSLTVAPVNSRHPSANIGSSERVLNYYWSVSRGSSLVYSATGSHAYSFPATLMGGTGGTLAAGYLDLSNPVGWITSAHGGSATGTTMTYTNLLGTNLPLASNTYHLTVGTINTLPNPIVPVYSRLANANVSNLLVGGNWNDPNSWTLQADGMGAPLGVAPFGAPVVILSGARINMNVNARNNFNTTINGLLVVGTSFGHTFGNITGSGILRTATNTLPAGTYTSFVSAAGGTIEYVAPMTMNNRNTYNNLSIIGAGAVTMTATNLVLIGNLSIGAGSTLNNTVNNANITMAGNWTSSGAFNAGTGTVTFNGSTNQSISGTTTFNNVVVGKPGGTLSLLGVGATTVNGQLTLTNGAVVTSSAHLLTLGATATSSGASINSYVSGPMRKVLSAAGSYSFPLGSISANRFRPVVIGSTTALDTWTAEYIGNDPSTDGFNHNAFNIANIAKVSGFEYWNISRSGATTASVTLSYNTGSYIPPDIGNVTNLRVARWNGSQWDLPPGGGSFSQTGNNIAGTVTVTNVTSFSPFTLSSLDSDSPLPVQLVDFRARVLNDAVELLWETASEIDNDYFTVERSLTGEQFISIGTVPGRGTTTRPHQYSLKDNNPINGTVYYRLKQTDYDGTFSYSKVIAVTYNGPSLAFINVFPNPVTSNELTLEIKGFGRTEIVPVSIVDQLGRECYNLVLTTDASGFASHQILFDKPLAAGVYLVKAGPLMSLVKRIIVAPGVSR